MPLVPPTKTATSPFEKTSAIRELEERTTERETMFTYIILSSINLMLGTKGSCVLYSEEITGRNGWDWSELSAFRRERRASSMQRRTYRDFATLLHASGFSSYPESDRASSWKAFGLTQYPSTHNNPENSPCPRYNLEKEYNSHTHIHSLFYHNKCKWYISRIQTHKIARARLRSTAHMPWNSKVIPHMLPDHFVRSIWMRSRDFDRLLCVHGCFEYFKVSRISSITPARSSNRCNQDLDPW